MNNNPSQLHRASILLSERANLVRAVSFLSRGGDMGICYEPDDESISISIDVDATGDQSKIINLLLERNSEELETLGVSV